jgi:class 3 adenylate cyclase
MAAMEPRIQYAKTADGTTIAFSMLGEGTPLVEMPISPFSHIQLEWQVAEARRWFESLAKKRKQVRYDPRGSGLSERDVADYSLHAYLLDVEAVVDHLGLERFALWGGYTLGPVAIAYAARHPERVSQLVLWCSWARASEAYRSAQAQTIMALREKDWNIYTETVAHVLMGWSGGEAARRFAALMRESGAREAVRPALAAVTQFDVTALMARVRAPTLVLHRRQVPIPDLSVARALASGIPHARLVLLEGTSLAPYLGDMEAVLSAIDEFLGEEEEATSPAAPAGLVTILFTDMEGSTALTQRLGDAKAQEVLRAHNSIVREALKAHGGSEIKHTGDGIMASFPSASGALECAIAIQRAFEEYNAALLRQAQDAHTEPVEVRVRIGLNAGEPIQEEKDLFGTAVQLAARVCARAEPGQILVPTVVRELAAGKGFLMADLGEIALRGFEDPVRLYEVRWEEDD